MSCKKQLREIEKFIDLPKGTQQVFKEKWLQELQEIELEHQEPQQRSQKKCKVCRTERSSAGKCAEEMERIRNEIEEIDAEAPFQEPERKIQKISLAEEDLDEEV